MFVYTLDDARIPRTFEDITPKGLRAAGSRFGRSGEGARASAALARRARHPERELHAVAHAELPEHAVQVRLHGLFRDRELFRDLGVPEAARDAAGDLLLARRERVLRRPAELGRHRGLEARRQPHAPRGDRADRAHKLSTAKRLKTTATAP